METNGRDGRLDDQDYETVTGFETFFRVPFFIIVGIVVVVWEAITRVARTMMQRGWQGSSVSAGEGRASSAPQVRVKVPMMPIDNYSQLDADEIISRVENLAAAELEIVRNYETDHENRQAILDAIDKRLAPVH